MASHDLGQVYFSTLSYTPGNISIRKGMMIDYASRIAQFALVLADMCVWPILTAAESNLANVSVMGQKWILFLSSRTKFGRYGYDRICLWRNWIWPIFK